MKKYLAIIALASALPTVPVMATIIGSDHDFSLTLKINGVSTSTAAWNTRQGVCSPCHTAHHTDPNQLVPLWAHGTTTQTFTVYNSPSMDAAVGQPSSASKACLSCHDGTVAVGTSFDGTKTGSGLNITGSRDLGTDLHITHPISIQYDDALATADGGLYPPSTTTLQWGGNLVGQTIQKALLKGTNHDQVECSSCHDPHKNAGNSASSGIMARISGNDANGRGSTLCRTCHNK